MKHDRHVTDTNFRRKRDTVIFQKALPPLLLHRARVVQKIIHRAIAATAATPAPVPPATLAGRAHCCRVSAAK